MRRGPGRHSELNLLDRRPLMSRSTRPNLPVSERLAAMSTAFCHCLSMERFRRALGELPIPLRHAVIGAAVLGVPGAMVGFAIGVRTYVPTAWAATFEVGLPAAFLGAVLGLVIGSLVFVFHRVRDRSGARTTTPGTRR